MEFIKVKIKKSYESRRFREDKRKVGDAHFEYKGKRGSAPVVFGEADDTRILGVLTLEALGFSS